MLDDHDRRILRHLQAEPTLRAAELAERVGLSPQKAWRRVERMEREGVIRGQEAVIDWERLGFAVRVSLRFTLDKTLPRAFDEFLNAARELREVTEIQTFLGRVDVRLEVIARDMSHWAQIYRDKIIALPHIADIEALMHVSRIKTEEALPV